MKLTFILLLTATLFIGSNLKKRYYPTEVMIGIADLIIVGEIDKVNSNSYKFKVDNFIKGHGKYIINVQMFKEWTCDIRQKKPIKGQKLFLFLKKKTGKYELINGSTGELFIENGLLNYYTNGAKTSVLELSKAIKTFASAYSYKGKEYGFGDDNVFIQKKTDNEIKKLTNQSELTKWLFGQMKNYKITK